MTVETLPLLGATRSVALPRVDLLPPEIAQQRQLRRAQLGAAAAVAGAAAIVGLLFVGAQASADSAKTDLAGATARSNALRGQIATYSAVPQTAAQLSAREAMLSQAMGTEVQWSHYLNDLALTVPANVWVTQVTMTATDVAPAATSAAATPGSAAATPGSAAATPGSASSPSAGAGKAGKPATAPQPPLTVFDQGVGKVTFTGVAASHDDVAVWLETLAKEKGYANPYFSNSTVAPIGGTSAVTFASSVTLAPTAYSGRYTKPRSQ